jgi:hypothetical protein
MSLTRKDFCQALAAGTALLGLPGCGGGGGDAAATPSPSGSPSPTPSSCGADISGNHGHAFTIARADLDSATSVTRSIQGSSPHNHNVTLTPAQLQVLKAGGSVTVVSTTGDGHDHSLLVSCT